MLTILILGLLPILALAFVTMFFVNELNKADERVNTVLAQRQDTRRSNLLIDIADDQIVLYEVRRTIDHD